MGLWPIAEAPDPCSLLFMAFGAALIYLGVSKNLEPVMLVPIGFGMLLANIPGAGLNDPPHGILYLARRYLLETEMLPSLAFLAIGSMMDFRPLLARPTLLLFGLVGQSGVVIAMITASVLGFSVREALAIGVIGCADGPTAIYVATRYAPHLLGAVGLAAYMYISMVPILQVPLMKLLYTRRELSIAMRHVGEEDVGRAAVVIFPLTLTVIVGLLAPKAIPLVGMLALGNFLRECGVTEVVERLAKTSSTALADVVTLFLGLTVGSSLSAQAIFSTPGMVLKFAAVFCLGIVAFVSDLLFGILAGKFATLLSRGSINPAIGASANSAFPISARVVQRVVDEAAPGNIVLMEAVTTNLAGQLTSPIFAGVIMTLLSRLGI